MVEPEGHHAKADYHAWVGTRSRRAVEVSATLAEESRLAGKPIHRPRRQRGQDLQKEYAALGSRSIRSYCVAEEAAEEAYLLFSLSVDLAACAESLLGPDLSLRGINKGASCQRTRLLFYVRLCASGTTWLRR